MVGLPPELQVAGVRAAVPRTVEGGVDEAARTGGVPRLHAAAVDDPPAVKEVASLVANWVIFFVGCGWGGHRCRRREACGWVVNGGDAGGSGGGGGGGSGGGEEGRREGGGAGSGGGEEGDGREEECGGGDGAGGWGDGEASEAILEEEGVVGEGSSTSRLHETSTY